MKAALKGYLLKQSLKEPYRLSFGTLLSFDTLIVALSANGQTGLGEITPLPGYSDETIGSAASALERVIEALAQGLDYSGTVAGLANRDPMVASALATARETLEEGWETAFARPVDGALPLAALCGGDSPATAADAAIQIQEAGHTHLKVKVGGGDVDHDLERIRAIAGVLSAESEMSVDANQRLSEADARNLCQACASLPVVLVEQPFPPAAWDAFAQLAQWTDVPLMLDESIWTADDVDRAAKTGARWVKLKLCKHPGIAANRALIDRAHAHGLRVIYGNGVQGAVGNHLEARIYADSGLNTPGEFNGVLKVAEDPFAASFNVENGALHAGGIADIAHVLARRRPDLEVAFTL